MSIDSVAGESDTVTNTSPLEPVSGNNVCDGEVGAGGLPVQPQWKVVSDSVRFSYGTGYGKDTWVQVSVEYRHSLAGAILSVKPIGSHIHIDGTSMLYIARFVE